MVKIKKVSGVPGKAYHPYKYAVEWRSINLMRRGEFISFQYKTVRAAALARVAILIRRKRLNLTFKITQRGNTIYIHKTEAKP